MFCCERASAVTYGAPLPQKPSIIRKHLHEFRIMTKLSHWPPAEIVLTFELLRVVCLNIFQLHMRGWLEKQPNGMFGIVKVDFYQHCKHHSTFASAKTAHFPIFLIRRPIRSIWMKAIWPSSVDIDDVKELLSDRILTLTWKTWWPAVECVPTQLWKKLFPSFCALYLLCYYPHTCFLLQVILNTKGFKILFMYKI